MCSIKFVQLNEDWLTNTTSLNTSIPYNNHAPNNGMEDYSQINDCWLNPYGTVILILAMLQLNLS